MDQNGGSDPRQHCALRTAHERRPSLLIYVTNHWDRRLVRGIVNGKAVEDYDPEIKPYEHTGFNFSYWFLNGLFLNGISWAWAIVLLVLTNAGTIFVTSKVNKRRHSKRK